jgi:hypothetical protein
MHHLVRGSTNCSLSISPVMASVNSFEPLRELLVEGITSEALDQQFAARVIWARR